LLLKTSGFLALTVACFAVSCNMASAEQPQPASGCSDSAQVVGIGINARLTICSAAARDLPGIRDQLARLTALSLKNGEQQKEISRFVKEVNAAGQLLNQDKRIETLAKSVSALLERDQSRTDAPDSRHGYPGAAT
jgi:hypothetical protein